MEIVLLLRLLASHFIADFILQPGGWVRDRVEKKGKSKYLLYHTVIIFLLTFLAAPDFSAIWIVLVVTITHFIIDLSKSYIPKDTTGIFVADQALHLLIILVCWLFYSSKFSEFQSGVVLFYNNATLWLYVIFYIVITIPASVLITKITSKWAQGLEGSFESLENAGKWIGIIERILILTFIVLNQFEAIGFLLAAKSVFRFGELKEGREQRKTEYILIGTLLSFSMAIIAGICLVYIINNLKV